MEQKVEERARQLVATALAEHGAFLQVQIFRRETPDHEVIRLRTEALGLKSIEQKLARSIGAAHNEQRVIRRRDADSDGKPGRKRNANGTYASR